MSRENLVRITGQLMRAPVADHETSGGWIWQTEIATVRTSGYTDMLQLTLPERVMDACGIDLKKLPRVTITGEIRRHRLKETRPDGSARWVPAVYAQQIKLADDGEPDDDEAELHCEVDRIIAHRETPLGSTITELRVTMQRAYGHWDSVILITWGGLAKRVKKLAVGERIHVRGRLQSRGYIKVLEDGSRKAMTTYEVSGYYVATEGGTEHARVEGQSARDKRVADGGAEGDVPTAQSAGTRDAAAESAGGSD